MPKDLPNADFSIKVIQGEPVEMPSADMLIDANFVKDGSDLVIQSDGQSVTVEGYFSGLDAPDLVHGSGLRLSPEMIDSFVKTEHAGEYAQGGSLTMNDASAVGQITEIVGDVMITRADGTEVIAEVGTVIQQGDVIETSADGAANILFADNTSFAVSEDARLSVDEFKYDSDAQEGSSFFSMLKGAFVYTSGMIGKDDPGNVNIETPTGSIGIRGTVVMGKIDPSGMDSEITILDGAVIITNAAGSVELNDMYETVRLGGYDQAPQNMGQMTSDYVQNTFKSLGGIARDTFGRAFGHSHNQKHDGDSDNGDGGEKMAPAPDTPINEQHGEMMQTPDMIHKNPLKAADPVVGRKMPLPPKALEAPPFSEGLPETSIRLQPPPADIQDPTAPPPDVFAFRAIDTTTFRAREYDDTNHIVGKIQTFGNLATGVTYSISTLGPYDNPFSIDSATGVLKVSDSFALNASDFGNGYVPINITATNSTGESITQTFRVGIDPLINDLSAPRGEGTNGADTKTVFATDYDQILFGGDGNDSLTDGQNGNNVLLGGSGNDLIQVTDTTSTAFKRIWGGFGDDTIKTYHQGNADIKGEAGNDDIYIYDNAGHHKVFGGVGNDTIHIYSNDPYNSGAANDIYDGGAGKDKLVLHNASGGSDVEFDFSATNAQIAKSIEEINLVNTTPSNKITLTIDGATVDQFSDFKGVLEINAAPSTGANYIELRGDWVRLEQYDGQLFSGATNSAAFQRVGTNEVVVTKDVTKMVFLEEDTTPGSWGAVDGNSSTAGNTNDYIPELSTFL